MPSVLLGNGLLLIFGAVDGEQYNEQELNDWYGQLQQHKPILTISRWTNEHLPERLSVSGFRRARRYYAQDVDQKTLSKYLVLYEVDSVQILTSSEYMAKLNVSLASPGTERLLMS
jgi:hypothetical protein